MPNKRYEPATLLISAVITLMCLSTISHAQALNSVTVQSPYFDSTVTVSPSNSTAHSSSAQAAAVTPAAVSSTAAAPAGLAGTTYTVVRGDTLWKLAKRFLGNGARFWEIVEANKSRYPSLAKNPNLILVGWQLVIPGVSSAGTRSSTTRSTPSTGTSPSRGIPPNPNAPPAPTGGMISTRSPEFRAWWNEALGMTQSWNFPENIRNKYGQVITRADLLKSILYLESHGIHRRTNGEIVTSSCGALGFMQLMPATARGLGVNPNDPRENLLGGTKFIGTCLTGPCTRNAADTPIEKLIKGACGYNRGPYASELRNKTWDEYVQTCRVDENVRYGIHVKICLGLELTSHERDWLVRKGRTTAANLDRYCSQYYSNSRGLI